MVGFDFGLGMYVNKSFKKAFKKQLLQFNALVDAHLSNDIEKFTDAEIENIVNAHSYLELENRKDYCVGSIAYAYNNACKEVEDETKQAMEAVVHNLNTLHSRAGSQTPFSSINFGMDTSPEGRLVSKYLLDAIWDGLGNGETPIFPISVFQLKAGVNYNPGDPNYDLFKKACKVSAKRLFPNFVSLDATYNAQYYDPDDYRTFTAAMGCRTRVVSNVNGPQHAASRGNFAFTTINLPYLALQARRNIIAGSKKEVLKEFFKLLDEQMLLGKEYLEWRYNLIANKKVFNFPFVMGEKMYMGSENLKAKDAISEALKNSSLSIGFVGLAECLKALIGYHHGESYMAQTLGITIVKHMRHMTDKFTEDTHMNWSTFGTPAENFCGVSLRATRKEFGVIEGVTDHEYFTNSSHIPVHYPIKALDKIRIEAPYHELENAGHIAYIEMDGNPLKNLKAFETLVRAMHDANMGYFSINHPVDRDPVCGYTGLIENECPHCHRREDGKYHFKIKRYRGE